MTLNYKDTPISVGGNKLMFGADKVKKLYFGGELVYQEMLPVGTILFSDNVGYKSPVDITLPNVSKDWSNIENGISINWQCNALVTTSVFTKSELISGQYSIYNGSEIATYKRIPETNILRVETVVGRAPSYVKSITVV